jgi:hypothetical protein
MSERRLKTLIAACFLCSQVATFVSLVVINSLGGFNERNGEMNTIWMLILPMFTVYTTTIVKTIVVERGRTPQSQTPRANSFFTALALSLILIYSLIIPALIWFRGMNFLISSFDELKLYLTVTQTGFALYLGLIVDALYGRKSE